MPDFATYPTLDTGDSSSAKLLPAIAWSCIGIAAGAALVLALGVKLELGLAVAVIAILFPVIMVRPELGAVLGLFVILLTEEFPGGLPESAVERSKRTAFYATSVGIHGLYPTDVIVMVLIFCYLVNLAVKRQSVGWPRDCVRYGLASIAFAIVVSLVASFMVGNPLSTVTQEQKADIDPDFTDRALQLIAFYQFKTFSCLFASYVLGLLAIREPRDVSRMLKLVGFAGAIMAGIGLSRLVEHPEWIKETIPVIYDTSSVSFFALIVFYTIYAWATGLFDRKQTFWMFLLSAAMGILILVSFRRTMWGGIALCFIPLLILLPSAARGRVLLLGFVLMLAGAAVVLATPSGRTLVAALGERAGETSDQNLSTLSRVAIFRYVGLHWQEIPLLGYGPRPLWNEFASMNYRGLRLNMENVHSFYAWLLFRIGYVGLFVTLAAQAFMLRKAWGLTRHARTAQYRPLGLVLLLAILLILFSGIVNPVYGETRCMTLWGLVLALLSRIAEFDKTPAQNQGIESA